MSVNWSPDDTPSFPEPGWPLQPSLPTSGIGALPFPLSTAHHHLPLPEFLRAFGLPTSCPATEFPVCVRDWPSMLSKVRLCIRQMGVSGCESGQHHLRAGVRTGGTLMRRVESTPPSNVERRPGWLLGGLDFSSDSTLSCLSDPGFISVFPSYSTPQPCEASIFIFSPLIRLQKVEAEFT